MWRTKAESSVQNLSLLERERNDLILKVKNLEEEQKSNNFKDKYESAAIELEQLRQVLKLKEEELSNLAKIRKQYNVEGNKNLNKEIKQLETRLIET